MMTLPDLQQAVYNLSVEDQLILLETLVQALKVKQKPKLERLALVNQLRGCLKKSGQPIPTDADITEWQEARLTEKYSL